ncbi:M48 family metalloprotease [Massilia sp. H-1]|nr:M48 family metalloprotease [Massilia sp. H-1]
MFYDLSLFNLIFPSKKNLEIGLALVNTLTLGELRAVLAHEFGHFAQRSMAVGRWVYVAQQIATHLVTRRDALDDFLVTLGNLDLRVRAVVAVVQLIIWSIRSLVESLFNAVSLMQRALSREMEMQADLVAVSLTGSDALIHALHRLQGADDAWDRALGFIHAEKDSGRATRDAFAVQTHMLQRMSAILNDDAYANVPPLLLLKGRSATACSRSNWPSRRACGSPIRSITSARRTPRRPMCLGRDRSGQRLVAVRVPEPGARRDDRASARAGRRHGQTGRTGRVAQDAGPSVQARTL